MAPVQSNGKKDNDPTWGPTSAGEGKKHKLLEKAKLVQLTKQLTTRLQYARLKVDHGWTRQTLNEVENLYFHHYKSPTEPAKVGSTSSSETLKDDAAAPSIKTVVKPPATASVSASTSTTSVSTAVSTTPKLVSKPPIASLGPWPPGSVIYEYAYPANGMPIYSPSSIGAPPMYHPQVLTNFASMHAWAATAPGPSTSYTMAGSRGTHQPASPNPGPNPLAKYLPPSNSPRPLTPAASQKGASTPTPRKTNTPLSRAHSQPQLLPLPALPQSPTPTPNGNKSQPPNMNGVPALTYDNFWSSLSGPTPTPMHPHPAMYSPHAPMYTAYPIPPPPPVKARPKPKPRVGAGKAKKGLAAATVSTTPAESGNKEST